MRTPHPPIYGTLIVNTKSYKKHVWILKGGKKVLYIRHFLLNPLIIFIRKNDYTCVFRLWMGKTFLLYWECSIYRLTKLINSFTMVNSAVTICKLVSLYESLNKNSIILAPMKVKVLIYFYFVESFAFRNFGFKGHEHLCIKMIVIIK